MDLKALTKAVETGKHLDAVALTKESLEAGVSPSDLLQAMVEGMDILGEKFKKNEIYVPEMLIAARAMKQAMVILEPELSKSGVKNVGTAVIGTVHGDLHDIGKNLVAMMWKGANFKVVDIGTNVPPHKFVQAVRDNEACIVGLSALLTTTMPAMRTTVQALRDAGLQTKIIVGGAPITETFANEIGADAYAPDAGAAVDTIRGMMAACCD